MLLMSLTLVLSESITPRLPEDPGMVYTIGFHHNGVKIGLDWQQHRILPERVCRKVSAGERLRCQRSTLDWLQAECSWYQQQLEIKAEQEVMAAAICTGATELNQWINRQQLVQR